MIKKVFATILCTLILGCCHIYANTEAPDFSNIPDKNFNRQTANNESAESTDNQNTDAFDALDKEMPRNFAQGPMESFPGGMAEDMPSFEVGHRQPGGMPSFEGDFPGGFGFPGGQSQSSMQEQQKVTIATVIKEYSTPIISMVLLGFGFIFVIFYKRNKF